MMCEQRDQVQPARFLTRAQAEALCKEFEAALADFHLCDELYGDVTGLLGNVVDEATVRPGDAGWCEGCEHWHPWILSGPPEAWTEGELKCQHPDYRGGHCPKEVK